MADPRDIVDVSLLPQSGTGGHRTPTGSDGAEAGSGAGKAGTDRPGSSYLRIWFRCANQYGRATKSAAGDCYLARCPTCMKTIRFGIGPGGTQQRFFEVSC
jgi:hypothetical protein